jgi:class 3 adenylate cyclase/pimeloyl-ACP methyl ester carboxylesterase
VVTDTRYVSNGGLHVAYQVVGDGPFDVLFAPTWFSNLEVLWESPPVARYLRRLASFSRLIVFDPRGCGLSDSCASSDLTMENRVSDALAVLDAAGSERAALFGSFFGGPVFMHLASRYPERFTALVLYNTAACWLEAPGYAIGWSRDVVHRARELPLVWGRSNLALKDSLSETQADWWQRYQRMSFGPGTAARFYDVWLHDDVRHLLATIRVPTLVAHRAHNTVTPLELGRYVAEHIDDARFLVIEGSDPGWFFDAHESVLDDVQEFLIGSRSDLEPDRALATILFTDLVASTDRTAALGDMRWHEELDNHDRMLGRVVARYGGAVVKTTGDGALVVFDRPSTAIRCGLHLTVEAERLGFSMRVGIHTGEIERRGDDVAGLAVVIAERTMHHASSNTVMATGTVRDLVIGGSWAFEDCGVHDLKGVPGRWSLWRVAG